MHGRGLNRNFSLINISLAQTAWEGSLRMHPINKTARVAAFLYLMGIPAPFGLIYVPSRLILYKDAAATASNILAAETLFRLGMMSNLFIVVINLLLVLAL